MPAVQCDQCDHCFPVPDGTPAGSKLPCPQCRAFVRAPGAVTVDHPALDSLQRWHHVLKWVGILFVIGVVFSAIATALLREASRVGP